MYRPSHFIKYEDVFMCQHQKTSLDIFPFVCTHAIVLFFDDDFFHSETFIEKYLHEMEAQRNNVPFVPFVSYHNGAEFAIF